MDLVKLFGIFLFGYQIFIFNDRKKYLWRFTEISNKIIQNSCILDGSFASNLVNVNSQSTAKFNGNCLRQDNMSFLHKNVINFYISDKLYTWSK